jgi:hydrogenase expression/formation protein HypD
LKQVQGLAEQAAGRLGRPPKFMEVCGTHTDAFCRTGLRALLQNFLQLRSGPGCPVCVTGPEDLDCLLQLCREKKVTLAAFGDMIRVPGSSATLEEARAKGASVAVVTSPLEAVALAERCPGNEVVFFGVGFETTAPATAVSIQQARFRGIKNFSVFSVHKLMPPALRRLLEEREAALDGLLLPGHVSAVTGLKVFNFIPREFGIPCVVAGFEPVDLLGALHQLLDLLIAGHHEVVNGYPRLVREEGNPAARAFLEQVFEPSAASWRGFGLIETSGLKLQEACQGFDAAARFMLKPLPAAHPASGCRCGDVLRGTLEPPGCPLFARACTPYRPSGPCMVSTEGACAAYYRYEWRCG